MEMGGDESLEIGSCKVRMSSSAGPEQGFPA